MQNLLYTLIFYLKFHSHFLFVSFLLIDILGKITDYVGFNRLNLPPNYSLYSPKLYLPNGLNLNHNG